MIAKTNLGLGLVSIGIGDQDVARLEITVDHALLMRVLDTIADASEQIEPLLEAQLLLVAVVGEGNAADQFHHEVGATVVGGPGIEDLRDRGVIHDRQGLPLGLEATDDPLGVHACLDDLDRHWSQTSLIQSN